MFMTYERFLLKIVENRSIFKTIKDKNNFNKSKFKLSSNIFFNEFFFFKVRHLF